ncbi:MAG: hypothetical protein IPI81_07725 [Flavobacteriales bacterium]|nr:hypothetical protein [Flavobacteriales bacterium]
MKHLLTWTENRIIFRTSRFLLHLLIVLGSLTILAGLCLWVWSVVPTSKQQVNKPDYPPELGMKWSDVSSVPEPSTKANGDQTDETLRSDTRVVGSSPMEVMYHATVDSLANAQPYLKWRPTGGWKVLDAASYHYWEKRDPQKAATYRIFQGEDNGLAERLDVFFIRTDSGSYADRIAVLRALFSTISDLQVDTIGARIMVNAMLDEVVVRELRTLTMLRAASDLAQAFRQSERAWAFRWGLRYFANATVPNAGFLAAARKWIEPLEADQQFNALQTLTTVFTKDLGSDLDKLEQRRPLFLSMLKEIPREKQALALGQFITAYEGINQLRLKKIQEIDSAYVKNSAVAEHDFVRDGNAKSVIRSSAWILVASGIAVLAILGLLLSVLSIQRSIQKLESAITQLADRTPGRHEN